MNESAYFLDSFFRIVGLCTIVIVLIVTIWLTWFGPGPEPGPTFPSDSQGEFIETPTVTEIENEVIVRWVVPVTCRINAIEFQPEQQAKSEDGWGGGTANCVEGNGHFACQAKLTDRGLLPDTNYRLQVHNAQCADKQLYVSKVITFSL